MSITKEVFDALRSAGVESSIIDKIDMENKNLIKLEGDERMFNKLTKQLGDNKIEDLLVANDSLKAIGGLNAVKELELKLATTEKEKADIEKKFGDAEASKLEILKSSEKLTNDFNNLSTKMALMPHLTKHFKPDSLDHITTLLMSSGKVAMENGSLMIVNGNEKISFEKGFDSIKSEYKYALAETVKQETTPPQVTNPIDGWGNLMGGVK